MSLNPAAKPLERKAAEAPQEVQTHEKRLSNAISNVEKARAWLALREAKLAAAQADLAEREYMRKELVQELH
eukprot:6227127-Pyramimonas_sp.AAC.1